MNGSIGKRKRHRDKITAMAHVGHGNSHRTLRLVARLPASDHWVVEA